VRDLFALRTLFAKRAAQHHAPQRLLLPPVGLPKYRDTLIEARDNKHQIFVTRYMYSGAIFDWQGFELKEGEELYGGRELSPEILAEKIFHTFKSAGIDLLYVQHIEVQEAENDYLPFWGEVPCNGIFTAGVLHPLVAQNSIMQQVALESMCSDDIKQQLLDTDPAWTQTPQGHGFKLVTMQLLLNERQDDAPLSGLMAAFHGGICIELMRQLNYENRPIKDWAHIADRALSFEPMTEAMLPFFLRKTDQAPTLPEAPQSSAPVTVDESEDESLLPKENQFNVPGFVKDPQALAAAKAKATSLFGSVSAWAQSNNHSYAIVTNVLAGKSKARYGQSYQAAKALAKMLAEPPPKANELPDPEAIVTARQMIIENYGSIRKYADAKGFNYGMVNYVLTGRHGCSEGLAQKIAVDLGIK